VAYYGLEAEKYLRGAVSPKSYRGHKIPKPITQEDADLILEHINDLIATRGIATSTAKVTATYLVMFARECPGLMSITTKDVKNRIRAVSTTLKQNTRRRYIAVLKRFLVWLVEHQHNHTLDLKEIGKIKAPGLDLDDRTAERMLTGPEIIAMIRAAKNSRDRALLAMMYEGALRPIELVSATWNNIQFPKTDERRAKFNTAKKTGKPRYIPLIESVDHILAWRNDYPGDPAGDRLLFVGLRKPHGPITQSAIKGIVSYAAASAGIERDINPYLFRHSRITHMLADEVPETIVKKIAWGSVQSHQLGTYAHLVDADTDRIMLAKAGIKTPEKKQEVGVRPRQCSECGRVNPATARYCLLCGHALTKKAATTEAEALARVRSEPEIENQQRQIEAMQKEILELKRAMKRRD